MLQYKLPERQDDHLLDWGGYGRPFLFGRGKEERMAKGKYEYWLTADGLLLLEGWARDGLTDEQIAHNCGISTGRLYEWKKKFNEIDEALKKGKDIVDYEVENALFKAAMEGNTTAQIFWLKNRRPDRWREKHEAAIDNKVKFVFDDAEMGDDLTG